MITVIRRQAKSRVFRAILLITVFSMTVGGSLFVPGLLRQITQTSKALITVNGQGISASNFAIRAQHEYERIETFRQQFGAQADIFLRMLGLGDPQQMAYEALVQEALLNGMANKLKLPLSEDFIAQQLQNPSFVLQELTDIVPVYVLDRDGTINITALKRYLQMAHLTMADFESLVEDALRRSTVTGLLQSTAYVSANEIRERFRLQYTPKNYAVLPFTSDRYLQKARQVAASDEELKAFFDQENAATKRYWTPETRTGSVWEFGFDNFDLPVPAGEVEAYYTKHKHAKYVESLPKIRLRRILLKVEKDADAGEAYKKAVELKEALNRDASQFENLAKQHSQDAKTASQGGLLGWYTRQELKPEIGTAVFRLAKDGDISDALRTDEGYELIQRIERKAKEFKPFDAVKDEIETALKKQRFSEKFKNIVKQKVSQQTPQESLNELKKTYRAQEKALNNTTLDESRTKRELFKLKKNEFMSYVDNGIGYVVVLKDIVAAHAPAFDEVKSRVQEDWYRHKARTMLEDDLKQAELLSREKSFEEVAAQFKVPLERVNGLSFEDKQGSEAWTKKGYPVADFYALRTLGEIKSVKKDADGYLVKLVSEGSFDEELFNKKQDEISRELYQETRERLQRGFVASLRRHATIKTSEEFTNLRNVK